MVPTQGRRKELARSMGSEMMFPPWTGGDDDVPLEGDKNGLNPISRTRRSNTRHLDRPIPGVAPVGFTQIVKKGVLSGFAKALAGGANAVAGGANAIAEHAKAAAAAEEGHGPGAAAAAAVAGGAEAVAGHANAVAGGANALATGDDESGKDSDTGHDDSDYETTKSKAAPATTDASSLRPSRQHPPPHLASSSAATPPHVMPPAVQPTTVSPAPPPFQNNPEIPQSKTTAATNPAQPQASRSTASLTDHGSTKGAVPSAEYTSATAPGSVTDGVLSSIAMTGSLSDANPHATAIPAVITSPRRATSTIYPADKKVSPTGITEKDGAYQHRDHGSLSAKEEMVLISISSIGGTIILGFLAWLIWRCYKRRGRRHSHSDNHWRPVDSFRKVPKALESAKDAVKKALSRVPIVNRRLNSRDRSWTNLGETNLGPFDEKTYLAGTGNRGAVPSMPAINTISPPVAREEDSHANTNGLVVQKPPNSYLDPRTANTLPPQQASTNSRLSEMSSLSSGFGDEDFIWIVNGNTTTVTSGSSPDGTTVQPPDPVTTRASRGEPSMDKMRRETVYTEASEDSPPRFRNVNSWVRQQSGRVRRADRNRDKDPAPAVPSLPPEQDFALMMPDGEEPRRVETTDGYVGPTSAVEVEQVDSKTTRDSDKNSTEAYGIAR